MAISTPSYSSDVSYDVNPEPRNTAPWTPYFDPDARSIQIAEWSRSVRNTRFGFEISTLPADSEQSEIQPRMKLLLPRTSSFSQCSVARSRVDLINHREQPPQSTTRRRAQNRAAQRAYRERKRSQLNEVINSLTECSEHLRQVTQNNIGLREDLAEMAARLVVLEEENNCIKVDAACAYSEGYLHGATSC
jgi:hypothetical protein